MSNFKKPILSDKPIFSQGVYDVWVGALEADKLPQYVVINRDTEVVEYTSEVTLGYTSWLDGIQQATAQQQAQFSQQGEQLSLDLAKAN